MFKGLFVSYIGNFVQMFFISQFIGVKCFAGNKLNYTATVTLLSVLLIFFPSIGKCGLLSFGYKINASVVGDFLSGELIVEDVAVSSDGGFKLCDCWCKSFFEFSGLFDEPLSFCVGSCANDSDESRQKNAENGDKHFIHDDWTRGILTGLFCCLFGQVLGFYLSRLND